MIKMTVTRERCVIEKFRKSTLQLQILCSFIKKIKKKFWTSFSIIFKNGFFFKKFKIKYLENEFFVSFIFLYVLRSYQGLLLHSVWRWRKNLSPSYDFLKKISFLKILEKRPKICLTFFYERTWNLQSKPTSLLF